MSPDQEQRLEEIFSAARGLPPLEQAAFLDRACGDDAELRRQADSLFAAHEQAGQFLQPTVALSTSNAPFEKSGDRIGRYKLLEQIGEGGFGVVWMAEQEEPVRRRVALKIIKLGMDTKEVVARFEAERQALAMMDHPHIAIVFDGGATDTGRPYFVMELVRGIPITDYCDANKFSTRERLELFMQVCQAVQHAHQKGVIHRDLKPTNILVTVKDDRPVPKVIDFGVAKATQEVLTEKTVFTRFHQWIGTPAYMSPEQAGLGSLDVDTRSDIYSLGVLLYELLTGSAPFDTQKLLADGFEAVMRTIREVEPPKPSTRLSTLSEEELSTVAAKRSAEPANLNHLVHGDLDWIVLKALEKGRKRRYESASAFEADLRRHLRQEPVVAAPPSAAYRLRRFARRNRVVLATASAFALVLVLGAGVSAWQAVRANKLEKEQQQQAREQLARQLELQQVKLEGQEKELQLAKRVAAAEASEKEEVERSLYLHRIAAAQRLWSANNVSGADEELDLCPAELRQWEWHYLKQLCHAEVMTLSGKTKPLNASSRSDPHVPGCVAYSPDGVLLATTDSTSVKIWDANSGKELRTLGAFSGRIRSLAFNADSRRVAAAGVDGSNASGQPDAKINIWDAISGRVLLTLNALKEEVGNIVFSPDGRRVAFASEDGLVQVRDAATGAELLTLQQRGKTGNEHSLWDFDHKIRVRPVAFSPDGKWLASARSYSRDGQATASARSIASAEVFVWDTATGQQVLTLSNLAVVTSIMFSPDGKWLAAGTCEQRQMGENSFDTDFRNGELKVWDAKNGKDLKTLHVQAGGVLGVAFSLDGSRVAASCGRRFASGGHSGFTLGFTLDFNLEIPIPAEIIVWDLPSGREIVTLRGHADDVTSLHFSPDGLRLASASRDETIRIWDISGCYSPLRLGDNYNSKDFEGVIDVSLDCKRLMASDSNGNIKSWNTATGEEIVTLPGDLGAFGPGDGSFTTVAGPNHASPDLRGKAISWDMKTGQRVSTFSVAERTNATPSDLAVSPDGHYLAVRYSNSDGPYLAVFEIGTGQELFRADYHEGGGGSWMFSPSGRELAIGLITGEVKVWNIGSRKEILTLSQKMGAVNTVAFNGDSRRLVVGSGDGEHWSGEASVWEVASGKRMLSLPHEGIFVSAAFTPDGQRLATISLTTRFVSEIKIWDATTGEALLTLPEHPVFGDSNGTGDNYGPGKLFFSPDGHRLLALNADGTLSIWNATPWSTSVSVK